MANINIALHTELLPVFTTVSVEWFLRFAKWIEFDREGDAANYILRLSLSEYVTWTRFQIYLFNNQFVLIF